MNKYEARLQLTWLPEFEAEYLPRLQLQAKRAARAVARKYGEDAEQEILKDLELYIMNSFNF